MLYQQILRHCCHSCGGHARRGAWERLQVVLVLALVPRQLERESQSALPRQDPQPASRGAGS